MNNGILTAEACGGDLAGRLMGRENREGRFPTLPLTQGGVNFLGELEKLRLPVELLAESWRVDAELIRRTAALDAAQLAENPVELTAEVSRPLTQLAIDALRFSEYPRFCAMNQIQRLTSGEFGNPRLSMATLARYGDVDTVRLEAFAQGEDALTETEINRLSIALLIVDRALNDRPIRDQVYRPGQNGGRDGKADAQ